MRARWHQGSIGVGGRVVWLAAALLAAVPAAGSVETGGPGAGGPANERAAERRPLPQARRGMPPMRRSSAPAVTPDRPRSERISLHFQNIEVRALLQVIADFTGLNVVTSDSVNGSMSVRLKDVPWEQALDIILQTRGLAMQRKGNVLWVAPQGELAARQKLDLEAGSAIQGLEPVRTQGFSLNYARAPELVRHLAGSGSGGSRMLSARGHAFAEPRTNQLFVTDVPSVLDQVQGLLAKLDIPVRQVMIEARIVEAGDSWGKSLGARLSILGQGQGGASIGSFNGRDYRIGVASRPGAAETTLYNLPAIGQNGYSPAALALSIFSPAAARFLSLEISALEADGKGKLVSSPRVVTADQTKALIEQGTELPYQVATASGATSLAFRKANLKLEVTPQITPEGNVILDLDVNKDSVGRSTLDGFAIDTKHIQTNVRIEDGGTLAIGGIFEMSERNDVSQVPVLGDIPVLGNLFKTRTQATEKKEMLVFITPKILSGGVAMR